MRIPLILNTGGYVLVITGCVKVSIALTGLLYLEHDALWLLVAALITISLGLTLINKRGSRKGYTAREGFMAVTTAWILASACGAIPYLLTNTCDSPVDAFFESISGFTTTGATVIPALEEVSRTIILWRSTTQWLGGLGIILLFIIILPEIPGSIHLFHAETSGPNPHSFKPRLKETLGFLVIIYLALTVIQVFFLILVGEMTAFQAIIHSFSTVSTGGFSSQNYSISAFNHNLIDAVIIVFMFLSGINFHLYYLLLSPGRKKITYNTEFIAYLGLVLITTLLLTLHLWQKIYPELSLSLRYSLFQTVSIITTTGFSTVDYDGWSGFARTLLLLLMFIGGCSGSTAGGIKIARISILLRLAGKEIISMAGYRTRKKEDQQETGILFFFLIYLIIFAFLVLGLTYLELDFVSAFSATAACLGNIGPGLELVGPLSNYADLGPAIKLLLSLAMLLGRLEIYAVLIFFLPNSPKKVN